MLNKPNKKNPKPVTSLIKKKKNRERNNCIYSDKKLRPIIKMVFLPYEQIAGMVEQLEALLCCGNTSSYLRTYFK